LDLSKLKTENKITDEEILKILEQPLARNKGKKKNKKKKKPAKKAADDDDSEEESSDDE
jgi:topoisomerase IA-like protein